MRTHHQTLKSLSLATLLGLGLSACPIEGTPGGAQKDPFVPPEPAEPYTPPAPEKTARRVVLLHSNDEHSHLLGFAPMSDYPFTPEADGTINPAKIAAKIGHDTKTVGGLVRRQYLINRLRAEAKDPVLLVSAGDATMGTIFHAATTSAAPDFVTMGVLGYDVMTLGNHELDWGPAALAAGLTTAQRTLFGGAVSVVASNLSFDDVAEGGAGSALKKLYGEGGSGAPMVPWTTRTLANGLKVGFLGLMGYEAALVSAGKGDITFSVPAGEACETGADCDAGLSCTRSRCVNPLDVQGHVGAIAADAQPLIDTLRDVEKVDLVVALTHLGSSEDAALAQLTDGIDVIIGGHSHERIEPTKVKQTVIVQAGDYGRLLGQITLSVAPDGAVGLVEAETTLHSIGPALDAEIFAGTNLAATPPVLSPAFERALTITGGLVGPVIGGLNAALKPAIGVDLLEPIVQSDHDVVGEKAFQDTNLMHLVTDASLAVVAQGACVNEPVIAVQANGVIRDSLRFGANGKTTAADIFGVLPLGASPWAKIQAPGYPVVMFRLRPVDLFVGADIGVTKGLESDSFFLSYSGMRVHYDPSLPPFDRATFDPMGYAAGGRVTRIELGKDQADGLGWTTIYQYDPAKVWAARWTGFHPTEGKIAVVTNLYLAGFLAAFGLTPRAEDGVTALPLPATALCQTLEAAPNCAEGRPALAPCLGLPGSTTSPTISWAYPELKEWGTLLRFLTTGLGGSIPSAMYSGDVPASPRVIAEQPE